MKDILAQDGPMHLKIEKSGDYVLIPREVWNRIQPIIESEMSSMLSLDVNDVGDLIRAIRLKSKLSQKEFAVKVGIKECQVSNFEKKKRKPRIETIKKIADVFGEEFLIRARNFQ